MPDQQQTAWWLGYLLGPQGLVVGLIALVFALWREWLVPGSVHKRVIGERDRALARLDRALTMTSRAVAQADPPPPRTRREEG